MGQRRDNQGRFARRLFQPAAPTAAIPTQSAPQKKQPPRKTSASRLKYDPRVDLARLEQALNPNLGWFTRRALRKDLERQFGKIDWNDTSSLDEASQDELVVPTTKMSGLSIETLRNFVGMTGSLWVRTSDSGDEQFQKVAEKARIEVRAEADPDVAHMPHLFATEHVIAFYGPISERHLPDNILFYPNSSPSA